MKVLLVATVQSHICQFHRPLVAMLHEVLFSFHQLNISTRLD